MKSNFDRERAKLSGQINSLFCTDFSSIRGLLSEKAATQKILTDLRTFCLPDLNVDHLANGYFQLSHAITTLLPHILLPIQDKSSLVLNRVLSRLFHSLSEKENIANFSDSIIRLMSDFLCLINFKNMKNYRKYSRILLKLLAHAMDHHLIKITAFQGDGFSLTQSLFQNEAFFNKSLAKIFLEQAAASSQKFVHDEMFFLTKLQQLNVLKQFKCVELIWALNTHPNASFLKCKQWPQEILFIYHVCDLEQKDLERIEAVLSRKNFCFTKEDEELIGNINERLGSFHEKLCQSFLASEATQEEISLAKLEESTVQLAQFSCLLDVNKQEFLSQAKTILKDCGEIDSKKACLLNAMQSMPDDLLSLNETALSNWDFVWEFKSYAVLAIYQEILWLRYCLDQLQIQKGAPRSNVSSNLSNIDLIVTALNASAAKKLSSTEITTLKDFLHMERKISHKEMNFIAPFLRAYLKKMNPQIESIKQHLGQIEGKRTCYCFREWGMPTLEALIKRVDILREKDFLISASDDSLPLFWRAYLRGVSHDRVFSSEKMDQIKGVPPTLPVSGNWDNHLLPLSYNGSSEICSSELNLQEHFTFFLNFYHGLAILKLNELRKIINYSSSLVSLYLSDEGINIWKEEIKAFLPDEESQRSVLSFLACPGGQLEITLVDNIELRINRSCVQKLKRFYRQHLVWCSDEDTIFSRFKEMMECIDKISELMDPTSHLIRKYLENILLKFPKNLLPHWRLSGTKSVQYWTAPRLEEVNTNQLPTLCQFIEARIPRGNHVVAKECNSYKSALTGVTNKFKGELASLWGSINLDKALPDTSVTGRLLYFWRLADSFEQLFLKFEALQSLSLVAIFREITAHRAELFSMVTRCSDLFLGCARVVGQENLFNLSDINFLEILSTIEPIFKEDFDQIVSLTSVQDALKFLASRDRTFKQDYLNGISIFIEKICSTLANQSGQRQGSYYAVLNCWKNYFIALAELNFFAYDNQGQNNVLTSDGYQRFCQVEQYFLNKITGSSFLWGQFLNNFSQLLGEFLKNFLVEQQQFNTILDLIRRGSHYERGLKQLICTVSLAIEKGISTSRSALPLSLKKDPQSFSKDSFLSKQSFYEHCVVMLNATTNQHHEGQNLNESNFSREELRSFLDKLELYEDEINRLVNNLYVYISTIGIVDLNQITFDALQPLELDVDSIVLDLDFIEALQTIYSALQARKKEMHDASEQYPFLMKCLSTLKRILSAIYHLMCFMILYHRNKIPKDVTIEDKINKCVSFFKNNPTNETVSKTGAETVSTENQR